MFTKHSDIFPSSIFQSRLCSLRDAAENKFLPYHTIRIFPQQRPNQLTSSSICYFFLCILKPCFCSNIYQISFCFRIGIGRNIFTKNLYVFLLRYFKSPHILKLTISLCGERANLLCPCQAICILFFIEHVDRTFLSVILALRSQVTSALCYMKGDQLNS